MKLIDLVNRQFGKWTVIERANNDKNGQRQWLCRCECGTLKIVAGRHLTSDKTHSCGCDKLNGARNPFYKHGEKRTRLYGIWSGMKDRCYNSNNPFYNRYGGRGISICDEWRNNYPAFKVWALTNGYTENLTIDRRDNNGNYTPGNCRWTTRKTQCNNRCSTRKYKYNGVVASIKEHCENLGLNHNSVRTRLSRGWTFEEAITGKHTEQKRPDLQDIPAREANHE